MFEELLQRLDQAGDIPDDRIALIEWRYLPVLIHSQRATLTLHKSMAQQHELFVMVLRALYKPDPESGFVEAPAEDRGNTEAIATRAHDLLRSWHVVPGSHGSDVDAAELEGWIEQARRLCQEVGRANTGDHCIGQMLAHAPAATDGVWPGIAVREVIKITRSHYLDRGVVQGLCNKRGPTWRDPSAGGEQERALVAQDPARGLARWTLNGLGPQPSSNKLRASMMGLADRGMTTPSEEIGSSAANRIVSTRSRLMWANQMVGVLAPGRLLDR